MAEHALPLNVAQLVLEHHAVLYRYAFRLTGREAEAEDLTQQTFLQAQAHLQQLREPAAARGWLFTILRNCWQKARRVRLRIPVEPGDLDIDGIPDPSVADSPIDSERLQQAIDELPDAFKTVVLMFYFEDCSYKEIAERTGLPVGTVMSRLSRAKGHLRTRLFDLDLPAGHAAGAGAPRDPSVAPITTAPMSADYGRP